jgi:hypothetical protein
VPPASIRTTIPSRRRWCCPSDRTARIWRVYRTTQELVDAARAKLTRCLTPLEREELYLPPEPRYEADPLYCLR